MSKRVTNLRPGVYAGPLSAFSECKGITLRHCNAVFSVADRGLRAFERGKGSWDPERWDQLKAVRDAVFDVASDTGFNPANHDLSLGHAKAVAEAMDTEARSIRAIIDKGRRPSLETFDHLFEVHEFVCLIIEQAMEPCL